MDIIHDPCIEDALLSHPSHTTWLRSDIKDDYVAKGTKHLDSGDWKTGFRGTTVAAAIKSVGDGL